MSFNLTRKDGEFLVKLARKAVEERLRTGRAIEVPEGTPPRLLEQCGVFVTLNSLRRAKKELRGCIGFPYATAPLARAVIESAINSATQDPRFSPISLGELDHIVFEISVLTPPELMRIEKPQDYPSKIKVGRDGLIVEKGYYKGLLLPQVPVEWNWDEEEFLCQCCLKAGLQPDCWLTKGTKIYRFSCVIAQETAPKGEIVIRDMRLESEDSSIE
ncbi:MAG: TIGR00296 family protein [Candidatus Bathyarchaeia archaeon]